MIQETVFIVTIALMGVVTAVFLFVALNASKPAVDYPPLQAKAYSIRSMFFWALTIAGVLITIMTTLDLPYAATRGAVADNVVDVNVKGSQWSWQLSEQSARAGDTVVFHVTASDVNHGLGVYDPDMRMVGQTQAMPGYVNLLEIKVDKPGTYKLLCMEYCGLAHHAMISEFTVTENTGADHE